MIFNRYLKRKMKKFYLDISALHKLDIYPHSCYITRNGTCVSGTTDNAFFYISREDKEDARWMYQEVSEKIDWKSRKRIPCEKKSLCYVYPKPGFYFVTHYNNPKKGHKND